MIAKVILGTMTNARKLVSIAERISCDVELCSGRYVVNAKSMLGVLSMPEFEYGELHIHTDDATRFWRDCLKKDFLQIPMMRQNGRFTTLQHLVRS